MINCTGRLHQSCVRYHVSTMSDGNQRDSEEEDEEEDDESGSRGGRHGSFVTTFFNSLISGGLYWHFFFHASN